MSRRKVDIRTSRKPNPVADNMISDRSTRSMRSVGLKTVPEAKGIIFAKTKVSKKTKKGKMIKAIKKSATGSVPLTTTKQRKNEVDLLPLPESTDGLKPRRRRIDAEDYIKRRFLYEDDAPPKRSRIGSTFPTRRLVQLSPQIRGCNSTAALMAVSSANLIHKKRKKNLIGNYSRSNVGLPQLPRSRRRNFKTYPSFHSRDIPINEHIRSGVGESETDEQTFSEPENVSPLSRPHDLQPFNQPLQESDDSDSQIHKNQSRCYKQEGFSPERNPSPNHTRYAEFSEFILDDHLLSPNRVGIEVPAGRTSRQRHVSKSLKKSDGLKPGSAYPVKSFDEFDVPSSDEAFSAHGGIASIMQMPEHIEGLEMHEDSRGPPDESIEMQLGDNQPLLTSGCSRVVDIEEFGGDLLPQRMVVTPATGSSRRKSPIRPMQIMRTEPLAYHGAVGERNGRDSMPYVLEPVHPRFVSSSNIAQQKSITPATNLLSDSEESKLRSLPDHKQHTGLYDLCAAAHGELADLHSTCESYLSPSSAASAVAGIGDFNMPFNPVPMTSVASISSLNLTQQLSMVNPNLVSVQSGLSGRIFLEANNICQLQSNFAGVTKSSSTNYTQSPYCHPSRTASKLQSNNLKTQSLSRRRPTILKRGSSGAINVISSGSTSSSVFSYAQTVSPTLTLMASNATPRLQPPFLRNIGAFTPGGGGLHKLTVNTPANVDSSLVSDSVSSSSPMGGQILRIVSPGPSGNSSSVAFAVVSCATSTASTTQTASSRLFGKKQNHQESRKPVTIFSKTNMCLPVGTQQATPVRYAVVRETPEGKKYFLLGTPSKSLTRQSEEIPEPSMGLPDGQDLEVMEASDAERYPPWGASVVISRGSPVLLNDSSPSHAQLTEHTVVS